MASIVRRTTEAGERRYDVRYRTPAGSPRTKTFKRSEDARRFVTGVEADKLEGRFVDPRAGRRTFGELAEEWLDVADVKPKTRAGYRSVLDRHLLPRFGADPISAITPAEVERFLADLRKAPVRGRKVASPTSPGTIRNVRNALSGVCRYAVRSGAINANPVAEIRAPKIAKRHEMMFLTAGQVAQLADAIDDRYRLAVLLSAYTGVRAGEMAALRVGRVEMLRRRLQVVESVGEVHGALVTSTPKNGRGRAVPIPRFLVDELATHIAPVADDPDALVFTAPNGGQVRQSTLYRRYFKPAAASIGMPDLRWHDLRHTAVALMVGAGVEPLVISRVLGHGSISITYDVYGHVLPSLEDQLGDAMDRVYADAVAQPDAIVRAMDAR